MRIVGKASSIPDNGIVVTIIKMILGLQTTINLRAGQFVEITRIEETKVKLSAKTKTTTTFLSTNRFRLPYKNEVKRWYKELQ